MSLHARFDEIPSNTLQDIKEIKCYFVRLLWFISTTGLRPIYVIFFKFLPISFQIKNNDEIWL